MTVEPEMFSNNNPNKFWKIILDKHIFIISKTCRSRRSNQWLKTLAGKNGVGVEKKGGRQWWGGADTGRTPYMIQTRCRWRGPRDAGDEGPQTQATKACRCRRRGPADAGDEGRQIPATKARRCRRRRPVVVLCLWHNMFPVHKLFVTVHKYYVIKSKLSSKNRILSHDWKCHVALIQHQKQHRKLPVINAWSQMIPLTGRHSGTANVLTPDEFGLYLKGMGNSDHAPSRRKAKWVPLVDTNVVSE